VLLSCAISLDGYLDDATDNRLLLSGDEDFDRVDAVRAGCDAILVGANTIRRDDPRLLVRSARRRAQRIAAGRHASPAKVTVTAGADLDPTAQFFAANAGPAAGGPAKDAGPEKIVYCGTPALAEARKRLGHVATVLDAGDPVDLARPLADLAARGVGRLLVEGGGATLTQFLGAGLADELQLALAPVLVGDSRAPRFVGAGPLPYGPDGRARLAGVAQLGDVAVLRYALTERFDAGAGWLDADD
jgi:5-amino-6-(5-phosphoribosylamino)uracil reductase